MKLKNIFWSKMVIGNAEWAAWIFALLWSDCYVAGVANKVVQDIRAKVVCYEHCPSWNNAYRPKKS